VKGGDEADRVTYVGHGTVLLEQDGARLITDPTLRDRMGHLTRRVESVDPDVAEGLDAILISHMHQDHFDLPSLRRLSGLIPIVVPVGGGGLAVRAGFDDVREVRAGDRVTIGPVEVEAVPAAHRGRRPLSRTRADALGYVVAGGHRVYFAGDTDLFEGMGDLGPLDLALLPVWGWGPTLGEGHLDPERAAQALRTLRPRLAVPIHWGTFFPLHRRSGEQLKKPPVEFRRRAAALAPEVDVRVLQPGETSALPPR
jgi:L-ascorbate metabolism protein UlaG (beta-lactamase superfamily)